MPNAFQVGRFSHDLQRLLLGRCMTRSSIAYDAGTTIHATAFLPAGKRRSIGRRSIPPQAHVSRGWWRRRRCLASREPNPPTKLAIALRA
eukprot:6204211-Pleurochrysis_carterae.AAC.6